VFIHAVERSFSTLGIVPKSYSLSYSVPFASLRRSEELSLIPSANHIPNWGANSPKIENENDDENDWGIGGATSAIRDASSKDG
jgi:hypothetical protein